MGRRDGNAWNSTVLLSESGRAKGIKVRGTVYDNFQDHHVRSVDGDEPEGDDGGDVDPWDTFRVHDLNAPMHMVLVDLKGGVTQVQVRSSAVRCMYIQRLSHWHAQQQNTAREDVICSGLHQQTNAHSLAHSMVAIAHGHLEFDSCGSADIDYATCGPADINHATCAFAPGAAVV
jgi:hypothetical protein